MDWLLYVVGYLGIGLRHSIYSRWMQEAYTWRWSWIRCFFIQEKRIPTSCKSIIHIFLVRSSYPNHPLFFIKSRLANAHRVLFENTLLLLSVLVLNTFATGSTRAVMILTWFFLRSPSFMHSPKSGVEHRFIRLGFNLVFFGVTLAIGGLAFAQGF